MKPDKILLSGVVWLPGGYAPLKIHFSIFTTPIRSTVETALYGKFASLSEVSKSLLLNSIAYILVVAFFPIGLL